MLLIDDQSIWQHGPSLFYMRFVWGRSCLEVFTGAFFCIKPGCVWPKKNSQSPNITLIFLEKSKHIFFLLTPFPSFTTTTVWKWNIWSHRENITPLEEMCVSESGCSGNEATLKTSGISNAVWVKRHDESAERTFCSRVQKLQCHSRRSADCYDMYVLVLGGKKFCFGFLYPPKIWIGHFLWVKNRSDETFKSLKVTHWGEWVQSAFSLVQTG